MGTYNFQGNVEGISSPQFDFISKVLQKKGFKGPDVLIEAVGTAADNFVASVKRIVIEENGSTFKMIAKLAPEGTLMREMGNLEIVFGNERVIYTEILPKFRELQKNAGVPKDEWFRSAECYGSNTEVSYEVILLEDLREDDFVMLDRFKPMTEEFVKIVLQKLAIFHSLSYALKHQEPETFDTLKLKLQDIMTGPMAERKEPKMFFQHLENDALAVLQEDKYKKLIKGSVSDLSNHAKELAKTDTDSMHSIIQQGDGWTNNILFKINGKTLLNCALIDYQMARESSPAYDIMYMLFNSTNHEQRQKHYYEFIGYYHSELDKSLHNYGLEASLVYPRDQLDIDLKRYAKLILSTSVMVSHFIIRKPEEASQYKKTVQNTTIDNFNADETVGAMLNMDQGSKLLFKSKLEGLIDSFLEFGLLDVN